VNGRRRATTARRTHGYEPTRDAAMVAFAKSWLTSARPAARHALRLELSLGHYNDWHADPPVEKETVVVRPIKP
jgi:hypothetical protein